MSDWFGLGVILLAAVLALVAASRLGAPREEMSVEEFEKRARTGGHTRAGMFGLQELLNPKAARAVAVEQDLKHGYYNKKRVPGDGDDEEGKLTAGDGEEKLTTGVDDARSAADGAGGAGGAERTESEERDA